MVGAPRPGGTGLPCHGTVFAGDICAFYPNVSGVQRFLNACCDYAAEYEIVFDCKKTVGVVFPLKNISSVLHHSGLREWRKY